MKKGGSEEPPKPECFISYGCGVAGGVGGVAGKQVLLTFGLLSPNKGIEYALRALPAIIRKFPTIVDIEHKQE